MLPSLSALRRQRKPGIDDIGKLYITLDSPTNLLHIDYHDAVLHSLDAQGEATAPVDQDTEVTLISDDLSEHSQDDADSMEEETPSPSTADWNDFMLKHPDKVTLVDKLPRPPIHKRGSVPVTLKMYIVLDSATGNILLVQYVFGDREWGYTYYKPKLGRIPREETASSTRTQESLNKALAQEDPTLKAYEFVPLDGVRDWLDTAFGATEPGTELDMDTTGAASDLSASKRPSEDGSGASPFKKGRLETETGAAISVQPAATHNPAGAPLPEWSLRIEYDTHCRWLANVNCPIYGRSEDTMPRAVVKGKLKVAYEDVNMRIKDPSDPVKKSRTLFSGRSFDGIMDRMDIKRRKLLTSLTSRQLHKRATIGTPAYVGTTTDGVKLVAYNAFKDFQMHTFPETDDGQLSVYGGHAYTPKKSTLSSPSSESTPSISWEHVTPSSWLRVTSLLHQFQYCLNDPVMMSIAWTATNSERGNKPLGFLSNPPNACWPLPDQSSTATLARIVVYASLTYPLLAEGGNMPSGVQWSDLAPGAGRRALQGTGTPSYIRQLDHILQAILEPVPPWERQIGMYCYLQFGVTNPLVFSDALCSEVANKESKLYMLLVRRMEGSDLTSRAVLQDLYNLTQKHNK